MRDLILTPQAEAELADACTLCADAARLAIGGGPPRCRAIDAPPRHRVGGLYHSTGTGPMYPVRLTALHPGSWESGPAWALLDARAKSGERAWVRGRVSAVHSDGTVTLGGWVEQLDQGGHRVHYSPAPPVPVERVCVDASLEAWQPSILRALAAWAARRRGEELFEHAIGAVYLDRPKPGRWRAVHTQGPLMITRPDSLPHGDIVLDIALTTPTDRVIYLAWQAMLDVELDDDTPEAA